MSIARDASAVRARKNRSSAVSLPIISPVNAKLDLQRQVHIATGGLGFLGALLGVAVSPWFVAMPLVVGAGLLIAGITGFCAMARLLGRAPWNRPIYARLFTSMPRELKPSILEERAP